MRPILYDNHADCDSIIGETRYEVTGWQYFAQVALSGHSSPQAEQHRALHSLAELFPPQHVEGLHPGLLLYFPLGDRSSLSYPL